MPSSATLQTPFSPKFHNLPLDYFYSATLAPFYSALDTLTVFPNHDDDAGIKGFKAVLVV
jgi:hypothetical protein